jgi:hypothetical protein
LTHSKTEGCTDATIRGAAVRNSDAPLVRYKSTDGHERDAIVTWNEERQHWRIEPQPGDDGMISIYGNLTIGGSQNTERPDTHHGHRA